MGPREQAGFLREAFDILKTTVQKWLDDKASRLAAALSFYTILSLAPLLLLIVSIGGLVVGPDEIQKAVSDQAQSLIGDSGKELVGAVFANADRSSGILGTIFGLLILAFGATGVVAQLQDALNLIWHVERQPGGGVRTLPSEADSFVRLYPRNRVSAPCVSSRERRHLGAGGLDERFCR